MNRTVIVMPGTKWQIPLVKKLKARGFRVIVFDLFEKQPAYDFADGYRLVNILNRRQCLEAANEVNPCAILSDECDIAVPTVAWLSECLGLRSIGSEQAELYTNKYRMRLFAQTFGIDSPVFYKCSNQQEALRAFAEFGKKMIMKPLDANSSRGVFSVNSPEDILFNFDESAALSKGEGSVLLEEYIDGEEFTVDGLKYPGGYFSLAVSAKSHFSYNENIARTLLFTYNNPNYDYDCLREINAKFVEKSGLKFGLTHAEYKYRNGRFYLIEIGARGGGNYISSEIVPFLSGIDTQECLIDWAVGEDNAGQGLTLSAGTEDRCAVLDFFDSGGRTGIVQSVEGEEVLLCEPVICSYSLGIHKGDYIEIARDDSKRIGYYIACCERESDLERIIRKVRSSVNIRMQRGL